MDKQDALRREFKEWTRQAHEVNTDLELQGKDLNKSAHWGCQIWLLERSVEAIGRIQVEDANENGKEWMVVFEEPL